MTHVFIYIARIKYLLISLSFFICFFSYSFDRYLAIHSFIHNNNNNYNNNNNNNNNDDNNNTN